ncbi:GNAT family N-acetyltransferase [Microbacterium sulfonylureivorans]|uniref:GNAT family N-acetyltransferase n=1 Tax=Microbacterium sulfonylureivorans TaxID=2486854 RepID=UPI000FD9BEA2|nr:GNAT family protein [Microbacterium sulfonylureivorans]
MPAIALRPWLPTDAEALQRAFLSTPDLDTQLGGADLSSAASARVFLAESLSHGDSRRNWAIVADGVAMGNVGLSAIEHRHDTAWAYYGLAESARGKVCAAAALAEAADWAFENDVFRIELGHRVNNPASCAVARRAGFIAEGIERQKLRYGDRRFDVELHARLRSDPVPERHGMDVTILD